MRGDSLQGMAYQLVVQCQIVSPAGTRVSMVLNRSYLGIYMCMQVDMHAITINEKKRGHKFKGEWGYVYGRVQRVETEGREKKQLKYSLKNK